MTINKIPAEITILSSDKDTTILLLGFVVGCVICGIITSSIISGKGHQNSGAWFWCGFFLGIIGIIIAACQTNLNYINYQQRSNYNPSPVNNGNKSVIFCNSCGTANSSYSTHCQSCGAKLAALSSLQNNKNDSWRCSCGALNYSYETSCHRCGKTKAECLAKEKAKEQQPAAAQKSITEQLEELKKLQEQGLITEADYAAKKKQILKL